MTPEQGEALNQKRQTKDAAEAAFQAHAADCHQCRTKAPPQSAEYCPEGLHLETNVGDLWSDLENIKRALGLTY